MDEEPTNGRGPRSRWVLGLLVAGVALLAAVLIALAALGFAA